MGDAVSADLFSTVQQGALSLLALLQPLTGNRATGVVTLTAPTGLVVQVRRNRYLYPVVDGVLRPDLAFKTAKGPAIDGSWLIDDAGTPVTIVSNLGGVPHNLPISTPMRLDPPSTALEPSAPIALTTAATGATDRPGYATLRSGVTYETMDGPAIALDLRRSALKAFPGVVVAWDSTYPQDGPSSQHAAGKSRAGTLRYFYSFRYVLAFVASRADSDATRRNEGLSLLNAAMLTLVGREAVDGETVSSPSGVRFLSARRELGQQEEYKKFYVYNMQVSLERVLETIDDRVIANWLTTSLAVDKP